MPGGEYRSILRKTAVLIAAQGVRVLSLAAFRILAARKLGDAGFGEFQFAFVYTALWTSLADLGFSWVLLREAARFPDRLGDYFVNAMAVRLPLASAVYVLMLLFLPLFGFLSDGGITPEISGSVYRLGAAQLLASLLLVHFAAFRTRDNTGYEAAGVAFSAVLALGLGVYSLERDGGAIGLSGAMLTAYAAVFLFETLVAVQRYRMHRGRLDRGEIRSLFRQALPLGIGTVGYQLYYQADSVLIFLYRGASAVGWYGAAYQLVTLLSQIPVAYFKVILPHYSEAIHRGEHGRLRSLVAKSYLLMCVLGVPLVALCYGFADRLVPLIYGPGYEPGIGLLQAVIWSSAPIWLGHTFVTLLIARGAVRWYQRYSVYAAAINILLNLVFIPRFGAIGAAWTTVFTEYLVNGLFLWRCSKEGFAIPWAAIVTAPLAAATASAILLLALGGLR